MNRKVEKVFIPGLIVSFGSATTINRDNSKILSFIMFGSKKFARPGWAVYLSVEEIENFISTTIVESIKINHNLNYDDNCVTYAFIYKGSV